MENMNIQHTQHTKVTWVRMACALSSFDLLDSAGFGDFDHWDRRTWLIVISGVVGLDSAGLVLAGNTVHDADLDLLMAPSFFG